MKLLTTMIALVCSVSVVAGTAAPQCANIGSRSEGWKTSSGKLLWANCGKQVIVCDKEGWVSYDVTNLQLLTWTNCSKTEANKPVCVNIGSKSEGWKINGKLKWDNCSEKAALCGARGSRSEGWYAADLELASYRLIEKTNCQKK